MPDLWRRFIPELCQGFGYRCGYLAMLDANGSVDHYLSRSTHRDLAYEWDNYRYATGWFNSSKQALNVAALDPFTVREAWFEIDLASLHLRLTAAVPNRRRPALATMIHRLRLDYGRRAIFLRQFFYGQFQNGQFTLQNLDQFAPMIATAIRRERLLTHLAANPSVSVQEIANVCDTNLPRAAELAKIWRDAGHLAVLGRGRNIRYRRP